MASFVSNGFDPLRDIPDLDGKVVLVTGGNAGIGAEMVRTLAAHNPSCLYLCARTQASAEKVVRTVHETHAKANITILPLDLSSFDSVKECAARFNEASDRLDLLFLNAGVAATVTGVTKEGFETQFGINHVGHTLLTQLLMPKVLHTKGLPESPDVRILVTSSAAGRDSAPKEGLLLDQMKTSAASISALTKYGHSKLANILFAKRLAQKYPSIVSIPFHPGVVKTEIWGKIGSRFLFYATMPLLWIVGITPEKGALNGLWCATARDIQNGAFYEPVGILKVKKGSHAENQDLADKLWEWTNEELAAHGSPGWP